MDVNDQRMMWGTLPCCGTFVCSVEGGWRSLRIASWLSGSFICVDVQEKWKRKEWNDKGLNQRRFYVVWNNIRDTGYYLYAFNFPYWPLYFTDPHLLHFPMSGKDSFSLESFHQLLRGRVFYGNIDYGVWLMQCITTATLPINPMFAVTIKEYVQRYLPCWWCLFLLKTWYWHIPACFM